MVERREGVSRVRGGWWTGPRTFRVEGWDLGLLGVRVGGEGGVGQVQSTVSWSKFDQGLGR